MNCKINSRYSSVFFDNLYYDCNVNLDLPVSTILRLKKNFDIKMDFHLQPYNPDLWSKQHYFGFTSDIDESSGWGNVSFNLLKNSKQYDVALVGKLNNISDRDIINMSKKELKIDGAMLWHEQPKETWEHSPFSKNIVVLPFETTLIPPSWVRRINKMDALFTPCKQNIKMFQDSGVRIPIELVHWGYNPKKFYPLERKNKTFTFGHMGALSLRKGTDILVRAFSRAFPNGEDVKLICKTSSTAYHFVSKDKRIEVQMGVFSHEELLKDFFQKVDCFVYPTRGEGWGMTIVEAMATGISAIATSWSGTMEFMDDKDGWLLDYKMVPAKDFSDNVYKENCGEWAEPDEDKLVELLRYCYEHQDEVKEKGKKASERMQNDFTWEKKIGMFHEAIDKHLK